MVLGAKHYFGLKATWKEGNLELDVQQIKKANRKYQIPTALNMGPHRGPVWDP